MSVKGDIELFRDGGFAPLTGYTVKDVEIANSEDVVPTALHDYSIVSLTFSGTSNFSVHGTIYGACVTEQSSGYVTELHPCAMIIYPGGITAMSGSRMVERIEVKRFDNGQGKIAPGDVEIRAYYRNASNQLADMGSSTRTVSVCTGKRFTLGVL